MTSQDKYWWGVRGWAERSRRCNVFAPLWQKGSRCYNLHLKFTKNGPELFLKGYVLPEYVTLNQTFHNHSCPCLGQLLPLLDGHDGNIASQSSLWPAILRKVLVVFGRQILHNKHVFMGHNSDRWPAFIWHLLKAGLATAIFQVLYNLIFGKESSFLLLKTIFCILMEFQLSVYPLHL